MRENQAIVIGDILIEELYTVHDIECIDGVEIGIVLFPNSILDVERAPEYDREAFQLRREAWNNERIPVWRCWHEEPYEEEE